MFERMFLLAEKKSSDLVVCNWTGIKSLPYSFEHVNGSQRLDKECTNIFETPRTLFDLSIFVWNKLYRLDLIKKYNLYFDNKITYAEDVPFNCIYLYYANNICKANDRLYFYRMQREGSITSSFDQKIMTQIDLCRKIINFYKEKGYYYLLQDPLLWIGVGFYRRNLFKALQSHNKILAWQYIKSFMNFFDQNYNNDVWKRSVRNYGAGGKKEIQNKNEVYTKKYYLLWRVVSPNWFIKLHPKKIFWNIKSLKQVALIKLKN